MQNKVSDCVGSFIRSPPDLFELQAIKTFLYLSCEVYAETGARVLKENGFGGLFCHGFFVPTSVV